MRTVQNEWDRFVELCMPPDAPEIQRIETRRAFYAGVQSMLNIVWEAAKIDDEDDEGAEHLEACQGELQAFGAAILAGEA